MPDLAAIERYYADRLQAHGATARGVDWNGEDSQHLRFEHLGALWASSGPGSVLDVVDFGCGYGGLVDFLRDRGHRLRYQGYDISPAMIAAAQPRARDGVSFTSDASALAAADYAVASGIFNVKLDSGDAEWEAYIRSSLDRLAALARRGFAFNVLSTYSDEDKRSPRLYYADPLRWFDYCKRHHSPRVALLHDYPLYEFTVLVRK